MMNEIKITYSKGEKLGSQLKNYPGLGVSITKNEIHNIHIREGILKENNILLKEAMIHAITFRAKESLEYLFTFLENRDEQQKVATEFLNNPVIQNTDSNVLKFLKYHDAVLYDNSKSLYYACITNNFDVMQYLIYNFAANPQDIIQRFVLQEYKYRDYNPEFADYLINLLSEDEKKKLNNISSSNYEKVLLDVGKNYKVKVDISRKGILDKLFRLIGVLNKFS